MAPTIDAVFMFASRLVVIGRHLGERLPREVELVRGRTKLPVPVDVALRKLGGGRALANSFVVTCQLDPEPAKTVAVQPAGYTLNLRSSKGGIVKASADLESVRSPRAAEFAGQFAALIEHLREIDSAWALLLEGALEGRCETSTLLAGMDHHRIAAGTALLYHGWVANAAATRLFFLLEELRLAIPQEELLYCDRADITKLLNDGGVRARTALHGVVLLTTIEGIEHGLVIAALGEAGVEWFIPEGRSTPHGTGRDLLRDISQIGVDHFPNAAMIASHVGELLARIPDAEATAAVTPYFTSDARPVLSIVVPFYRDAFHLLDHIESQARATADAEWLFVCDDPPLLPAMLSDLQRRRSEMRHTTRLVALDRNVGFAAACNIGFHHATADNVVFMNPDVYWTSFAPLAHAARLLAGDAQIGAVGFTLHYEDGSIQHDGMRLERASELDKLLLCVNAGRGLPSPHDGCDSFTAREVAAVSSALMMVRRGDFTDHVFDESYIGRGFEDYDLCLELASHGKKVLLIETGGLYHLERHASSPLHVLELTTCVNCVRFNEKWGDELEAVP